MYRQHECGSKVFAIAFIALLYMAACCPAFGAVDRLLKDYDKKIRQKSTALDSIRSELERGRRKLSELNRLEGSHAERLLLLEKNMATAQHFVEEIDVRIDMVNGNINTLRDSLARSTRQLAWRQEKMMRRLRSMYMCGNPPLYQVVLSSAGVSELFSRVKYFQELKDYDRRLLRAIDSTRSIVAAQTTALEQQAEQLVALKAVKESEQDELRDEAKKREEMLVKVRGERKAYEQIVKELEQSQRELTTLLKMLEEKRKKAKVDVERAKTVAFEKRQGKLPWPVDGTVIKSFGKIIHPVYKTVTMSTGIDIAAQKGTSVSCVAPGKVDYVGWMRGYGKFVIINHFGGYLTIYAHLDAIDVAMDEEVKYGTLLGTVGETGTGATLHFQIRRETDPLDPGKWLETKQ